MEVICWKKEWYHPWHVIGTDPHPNKSTLPTALKFLTTQALNLLLDPIRLETKKTWRREANAQTYYPT